MFRKAPRHQTIEPLKRGVISTTSNVSFTTAMEYTAALEKRANVRTKRSIDLRARVDVQTVLNDTTYCAVSAVSIGTSKELTKIWTMMKLL